MFYYRVTPTMNLIMLPFMVVLTALLALGVGMWMSALNVKYRDIRYALPFAIQLLMFATPIIYPSSMVPAPWKHILIVNPLAGIIEGYRSALVRNAVSLDIALDLRRHHAWAACLFCFLFQEHRTHLRRYCLKKERESTTPLYPI